MAAVLIGYAVAIAIVFFASRCFSINRPRSTRTARGTELFSTYLQIAKRSNVRTALPE
jgi:hypothetical protein